MDDNEIFDEKNIPESNWFKFEKVGDKVTGEVIDIGRKEERDGMPAQRVFILKRKNGVFTKVGVKETSDYLMGRTNMVRPGDQLGFEFKAEIPAKKKGYSPAKSIEVYVIKGKNTDEFKGL